MLCQVSVSAHISGPVVYHVIYSLEMGLHRELNEAETVNICFFTYVFSVQATFSHTDRKIVILRHNIHSMQHQSLYQVCKNAKQQISVCVCIYTQTTFVFVLKDLRMLSMILVAPRTLVKWLLLQWSCFKLHLILVTCPTVEFFLLLILYNHCWIILSASDCDILGSHNKSWQNLGFSREVAGNKIGTEIQAVERNSGLIVGV